MERDELLDRLHSIDLQISLTAMPSEYALEVYAISKHGTSYFWCGMDDWCAYKFNGIDNPRWRDIKGKLATNSLCTDDLSETELINIIPEESVDCSLFFAGLKEFTADCPEEIFCFYDGEAAPLFFSDENQMVETLEVYLQGSLTRWEDIDTLELKNVLDNYEQGTDIPYISFD